MVAAHRGTTVAAVERVVEGSWGTALLSPSLPRIWSLNLYWVDDVGAPGAAEGIVAEADRLLGDAGLPHRRIVCPQPTAGERLASTLHAAGYDIAVDVFMTRRGDPPPAPAPGRARPAQADELLPAYQQAAREEPDDGADVFDQLVAMRARWPTTHVAAFQDGEPVSFCQLHIREGTAEVDDVTTLQRARRQGHARELMAAALATAAERDCDLVFLRADPNDWPKDFYRRLGFRTVGRVYAFLRRG